jgi:Terminase RNaseH-like domain
MTQIFKPNNKKYKVLTPTGYQPFAGVAMMGVQPILRLEFEYNAWIECTYDHKFYINDTDYIEAANLNISDTVLSSVGDVTLLNIVSLHRDEPVYDLIEVNNGHRYYTNTLVSSNCEFLVYDETLVNSLKLVEIYGKEPITKMGQVRWYKSPTASNLYLVALDPSLGTGGDFSAITVFELPSMIQVAEWHHNITPVQGQIKLLRDILLYIQDELGPDHYNSIYWSIENNTVGESALVVVENLGEETFPGLFVSEPGRKGHVRKFRKGFNTTFNNKIAACSKLKYFIEEDKMTINSKPLISELKTFIAHGISFKGKPGQHDDLVAALLLVVRMIDILAEWDPMVFERMRIEDRYEDWEAPLPIFVSSNM